MLIDEFLDKLEEWVERSQGKIRADVAHDKLVAMGFAGFGAHHPAGGRRGQDGVSGRAPAGASAVDPGAGDVAAVRLR